MEKFINRNSLPNMLATVFIHLSWNSNFESFFLLHSHFAEASCDIQLPIKFAGINWCKDM